MKIRVNSIDFMDAMCGITVGMEAEVKSKLIYEGNMELGIELPITEGVLFVYNLATEQVDIIDEELREDNIPVFTEYEAFREHFIEVYGDPSEKIAELEKQECCGCCENCPHCHHHEE